MDQNNVFIILNGIQILIYLLLLLFTIRKIFLSLMFSSLLVAFLHILIVLSICISIVIVALQIASEISSQTTNLYLSTMINIFRMCLDSLITLMFSFYWKKINEVLRTPTISESFSLDSKILIQISVIILWILVYLAYFLYIWITNTIQGSTLYVTYYGCQVICVFLTLWANTYQIIYASSLSKTLLGYQHVLNVPMSKTRFWSVWISTSVFSLLRMCFLIISTISVIVLKNYQDFGWWVVFIYNFSDIVPLSLYILSFQIRPQVPQLGQEILKQQIKNQRSHSSSSQSRHETQLSSQMHNNRQ